MSIISGAWYGTMSIWSSGVTTYWSIISIFPPPTMRFLPIFTIMATGAILSGMCARYFWLNLALGGQNGGSLAWTPRPLRYLIDYARVYQKIGTDGKATYLVDDKISEPTFSIKDGEEASVDIIDAEKEGNRANRKMIYNLQGINIGESESDIHDSSQVYIVVDGSSVKKIKMSN